jgi:peptidoglycan/LPS O-acetylase OafA/YrhL
MKNATKTGTLNTLQAGRGLAAIAVVLFHADATLSLPKYFGASPMPLATGGHSGVHFFFVLSGLIMIMVHGKDIGSGFPPLEFWWKRARRILPPLWAALGLTLACQYLVFRELPGAWAVLNSFTVAPVKVEDILAVEWTLRHEAAFYLLFGLLIWRFRFGMALMGAWAVGSLVGGLFGANGLLSGVWLSANNLLFLAGCALGLVVRSQWVVPRPALVAAAGAVTFAGTWALHVLEVELAPLLPIMGFGLGSCALLLGSIALERAGRISVPKVLSWLGDASYSIYLVHFLAISVGAKLAMALDARIDLTDGMWFAVVSVGGIAAGIAFYYGVERPLVGVMPARLGRGVAQPVGGRVAVAAPPPTGGGAWSWLAIRRLPHPGSTGR